MIREILQWILYGPRVRLAVWDVSRDRRSNSQRDRDIESTWRTRVRMNERRREMKRQGDAKLQVALGADESLDVFRVNPDSLTPIPIPHTRFHRRQAD